MSRPRILLTTDQVGGVWDFARTLLDHLDADWTVLALGPRRPTDRDVIYGPLKLEWMHDAAAEILETQHMVHHLVREHRPDVIHANQFAVACAEVDVPIVLTVHSDVLSWRRWTLGSDEVPAQWRSYSNLVQRALRRATRVTSVSHFLADQLRDLYAFDGPIDVIHNGWPLPVARPNGARHGTLLAGRIWDTAKNIHLAAQAAQGWDVGAVYLAGDQYHPDSHQPMPIAPPLQPLGLLSRALLDEHLQRAQLYLSPARYDPFGLLPLQAALSGAALLLSDIPSYRELWDGAARFFRPDDAADLRSHWQSLLESSFELQRLAAAAHARASERFTATRMASAYQRLYASVTARVAA